MCRAPVRPASASAVRRWLREITMTVLLSASVGRRAGGCRTTSALFPATAPGPPSGRNMIATFDGVSWRLPYAEHVGAGRRGRRGSGPAGALVGGGAGLRDRARGTPRGGD